MSPRNHSNSKNAPDAVTAELLQATYRYALSLSACPADAEDLVQEAWLRSRERYGADADRQIVFRIVRNLYIDGWRRARRFPTDEFDTTIAGDRQFADTDSSCDPVRNCGEGALGRHLAALRDIEREVLLLSVVEGYSAREIAVLTDLSRGSVLSLVHRAKAKMQQGLDADEAEARARRTKALQLVVSRNKR